MAMFRRKNGEKATLLSKCGESLFGCSGEMLPTQGIYVPKSLPSSPTHFICKRTVWIPDSISHKCLVHNLESFGATLPFSIQKVASLHRFGLCGITPTRTLHAEDQHFLLLAKIPHKYFAVYGIVKVQDCCPRGISLIESISTNNDDILNCAEWMKKEVTLFHLSKEAKNKRLSHDVLTGETSDQEGKLFATGSEPPTIMERMYQYPVQYKSDETESELSVHTPEDPNHAPLEFVNPQNTGFNGVYLSDSNTILWVPCLPPQSTTERTSDTNPFFISS